MLNTSLLCVKEYLNQYTKLENRESSVIESEQRQKEKNSWKTA